MYVEHWLLHLLMNVKNAVQIGNACMDAYENKLPQGFYNKISSYGVTMDTPMKGINMGAVRTVDWHWSRIQQNT